MKKRVLIIGAGLYGSTLGYLLQKDGFDVKIIEKDFRRGGALYCQEDVSGIIIHKFGPHIFHTSNEKVWEFVNHFVDFNDFILSPIAKYKDETYNLPFNMNTFTQIFGDLPPYQIQKVIEKEIEEYGLKDKTPSNLTEQAISMVGTTIFEKLVKGYTEKQWGCSTDDLPPSIIKRLPLRWTFDNNYFNDKYQGVPVGGYNSLIRQLTKDIPVVLGEAANINNIKFDEYDYVVCSGPIDEFFGYRYGDLGWRSLSFISTAIESVYTQGCAIINYTGHNARFTRVYEHAYFNQDERDWSKVDNLSIRTFEFPTAYSKGINTPFYPIETESNLALYQKYLDNNEYKGKLFFGGRLGGYKYLNMDQTIEKAMEMHEILLNLRQK